MNLQASLQVAATEVVDTTEIVDTTDTDIILLDILIVEQEQEIQSILRELDFIEYIIVALGDSSNIEELWGLYTRLNQLNQLQDGLICKLPEIKNKLLQAKKEDTYTHRTSLEDAIIQKRLEAISNLDPEVLGSASSLTPGETGYNDDQWKYSKTYNKEIKKISLQRKHADLSFSSPLKVRELV